MAQSDGRRPRGGLKGRRVRAARGGNPRRQKKPWRRWSAAAEAAFFDQLAGSGNVRAAADAAGFSRSTVYGLRRSRADFAEKWARALAHAGERPARAGSTVRYWRDGRAKRVRCFTQWSEEVEELFLDVLAATCNVTIAAEQAQVGYTSVYRQRRLRADFAAKWQAALAQGYARLEMALVEAAVDSLKGVEFDADRPIPKMSAETALKVLQLHRAAVTGQGKSSGWKAPPRSVEHYRASIMRKIEAIRRGAAPEEGQ